MNRDAAIQVEEVVEELASTRRYRPYPEHRDSGIEWLGELPSHWEPRRLKSVATTVTGNTPPKRDTDNYDSEGIPWVKPDDLGAFTPVMESKERLSVTGEALARPVPENSSLVCCIGSVGKLGVAGCRLATNQQINSVVFRATKVHWRFGLYALHASEKEHVRRSNCNVVAILNADSQRNISFAVPPIPEQREIADFLNRETARIDELIAKKQRLIELLAEKRTALISHVVTKGLNPDAPMKDSSIDWVGLVPEHWEVVPLRWHFSVGSGEFISNEDMSREKTDDTPHPVIGGNGVMGFTGRINTLAPTIVLGRVGALCGNVHLVDCDCWVTDNALRLSMIRRFDQGYLALQLQTMDLNRWANMNAQPLITGGMVKEKYVALPPVTEQQAILAFLNVQAARLDELMTKVANAIDKLREYRSALISAAVTGKIDVRCEVN